MKLWKKDNLKYYKFHIWCKGTVMNKAWIDKHKKEDKYFRSFYFCFFS